MDNKPPSEPLRLKLQQMRETTQRLRRGTTDKGFHKILDIINAELKKTLDRGRH